MRKVLALVLALTMALGSFSFVSAAEVNFPDTDAVSVEVLAGLGVVDGYPDGTFKPANIVTRAEMTKMIVVALGLEDFAVATTSPYSDMWQASWAQGFVSYATSLGIITGYPDGTFKPNQTVSYNEAAAMIVRALGYTADFLPGEWPAEWVVKAKTLGILDGITAATSAGATRGDIAKMLYAALDEEIGYVNKDGDFIESTTSDTMLIRLGSKLVKDKLVYGDEDSAINLRPYVGMYVDYYLNGDDEIIVVKEKSTTLEGTFTSAGDFKAAGVTYTGATATPGAIFVNGDDISTAYTPNTNDTYTLEVKLSGKSITTVYSLSKWVVSADDYFANADADDIELDLMLFGKDFVANDDDEIDMMSFELVGVESLDDIEKDDLVYVYESSEGIRKIEVSNAMVEGEVTRVNSAADTVTVGGKAYKFAVNEINGAPGYSYAANDVKSWVGENVTLYLDAHGFIYEVETESSTADQYAVLLNLDESTSVRVKDAVRLFLADGTAKWFDVATAAEFDGIKTTSPSAIVKYGVNDDGEIDIIDMITPDFTKTGKVTNYFNGKPISTDVVVFTYESGSKTDPANYSVTTLAKIKDSTFAAGEIGFVYDSPSIKLLYLVGSGVATTDDVFGIYASRALDSSSATDYMITYWVDGAKVEYEATTDGYNAGVYNGTDPVVKLQFNAKNQVTGVTGSGIVITTATLQSNITSAGMVKLGTTTSSAIEYFVEDGAAIFVKDGSTAWKLGSRSDLRLSTDAKTVVLYDTDSTKDGVADIVVVY